MDSSPETCGAEHEKLPAPPGELNQNPNKEESTSCRQSNKLTTESQRTQREERMKKDYILAVVFYML
jgi:hypothetical protein